MYDLHPSNAYPSLLLRVCREAQQEVEAKVAELDALQQWMQALEGVANSIFLMIMFRIAQTQAVGSVEGICLSEPACLRMRLELTIELPVFSGSQG